MGKAGLRRFNSVSRLSDCARVRSA
ncbi:hypothetical protein CLS_12980 [[Clostridium] cf. saccharolyticum K10]|nr:hypothetical protein CLS_12980 [[Clostridium] cf. saccharolyticum K10]